MSTKKTAMLMIGVAACAVWLSLVWSPEVEAPPAANEAAEPEALELKQPEPVAEVAHRAVELQASAPKERPAPAPDASLLEKPERIPTPHPMSLDQSKPPEQYGALAELKKQYETESRGEESSETEAGLRALINTPNIPAELVQDITCRRSLCKIEAHWTPRRRIGFAVLLESFKQMYSQRVAVEPALGQAADSSYVTTLYMRLKP